MFSILVVEDDPKLSRLMTSVLSRSGYQAAAAGDGQEALDMLDTRAFDLLIVDLMMPRMDGLTLLSELRGAGCAVPALIVTARESFEDKRLGFMAGADDYMVKPIDVNEMVLRVGALLKRARIASERRLSFGGVELNYDAFTVTRGGVSETLPNKEFLLLFFLLSYPGKIFTRQQLMDEIWGYDSESDARTVDVHIGRLRDRFRDITDFEIVTVRGLGYKAVPKP